MAVHSESPNLNYDNVAGACFPLVLANVFEVNSRNRAGAGPDRPRSPPDISKRSQVIIFVSVKE